MPQQQAQQPETSQKPQQTSPRKPTTRTRRVLKWLGKAVFFTVVFFIIVECAIRVTYLIRNSMVTYVPLPYVLGDSYGPVPPWLEDNSIFAPDEDLIWKNRPNLRRGYVDLFSPAHSDAERITVLRRFRPSLPSSVKGNPVWEIALNSDGFRDAEFPDEKPASAFRIVCLGDSWTFGMGVGQTETYPQQLKTLLGREHPEANFEVFNCGVLGYSSHQGLKLLQKKVLDLNPDVVVIGYAMNDSKILGLRDKDWIATGQALPWKDQLGGLLKKSETFRLLQYVAQASRYKPQTVGDHLRNRAEAAGKADGTVDFATLEPWTRVSPADYEKNIREMVRLARSRNADVILLYNEFWRNSPYQQALEKIAQSEGVPLVDTSALVEEARGQIEQHLEKKLNLEPVPTGLTIPDGKVEVVFRVYLGKNPVPKGMYIVGPHTELGDLVPNKVAMYDDGTHGDQKAGDGVWSYTATFAPGTKVFYVYTNSGTEGEWEGLDVPYIREFKVEAAPGQKTVYRPVESFGKVYMQPDAWHTDAQGYELVAKALSEALKKNEKFQKYVRP
jgi:lysophospholipase L1-like esterase